MFHRSDKRERVVKAPDKPVQIKKLKFGGDQTEGGGRFKGSIIEEEGDLAGYKKAVTAAKAASPVPQATQAPSPAAAGKSTPTPTPTPKPTPASRPAPSP